MAAHTTQNLTSNLNLSLEITGILAKVTKLPNFKSINILGFTVRVNILAKKKNGIAEIEYQLAKAFNVFLSPIQPLNV